MMVESVRLRLTTSTGTRAVALDEGLSADAEERAAREEIRWIKALRLAGDGTRTVRDALTYRGDSLWWFIELYLHKHARVRHLVRGLIATETLIARERPTAMAWVSGDPWIGLAVHRVAERAGIAVANLPRLPIARERAGTWGQSLQWTSLATLGRLKPRPGTRAIEAIAAKRRTHLRIVGYVHTAFWRAATGSAKNEGSEGYLGPVIDALRTDQRVGDLPLVGLGPRSNFRARRWWHPVTDVVGTSPGIPITPIEAFSPLGGIWSSWRFWRRCTRYARWLSSRRLKAAGVVLGYDLWPAVREELRAAALLQLPWSARAMDEAATSLDALRPDCVFTYAEAGGWGRALVLESRRRGIPSVGVQHGFIYRHWLNYLHEPDEMAPSGSQPADAGFPRPTATLLFDEYAAQHLRTAGAFPHDSLRVTGSPSLDRIVEGVGRLNADDQAECRRQLGSIDERIVLVVSKFSQISGEIGALVDATRTVRNARLVLVPHPAETDQPYLDAARGNDHVTVAPRQIPLPTLLAITDLLVTVNSTVGIDALVLDVPCLVVGLPTNLSPFVDAGVMAGARSGAVSRDLVVALLEDDLRRGELAQTAARFRATYAMHSDGRAAQRAAAAVVEVCAQSRASRRPAWDTTTAEASPHSTTGATRTAAQAPRPY